jgi:hypothetical protein
MSHSRVDFLETQSVLLVGGKLSSFQEKEIEIAEWFRTFGISYDSKIPISDRL